MDSVKVLVFWSIVFCFGLITLSYYEYSNVYGSLASNNSTQNNLNYTIYSNDRLGISFEYPSDWNVEEKINRFSKYSDVQVHNGSSSFKVMKSQSSSDTEMAEKIGGLKEVVGIILPPEERVVGAIEENMYAIDGTDTVSVLTAMESLTNVPDQGLERILLIQNDVLYILTYQNTVDQFDSKQSQETIGHILASFRFIDSSNEDGRGSDNEDGDDND
ncbi:PsbP-related protein [Candidatus Nitrosocosmicus sp. T]